MIKEWQFQMWVNDEPFNFTNWGDCKAYILHLQENRQIPMRLAVRGFTLQHLLFLRSKLWHPEIIWENNGHAYSMHRYTARMYAKLWNIPAGELPESEVMKQGKGSDVMCRCLTPPEI